MEENPRVLELTGWELHKVMHAYGTNGIITEVEIPLDAAYDWVDVIVGADDYMPRRPDRRPSRQSRRAALQGDRHRRGAGSARLFPPPPEVPPPRPVGGAADGRAARHGPAPGAARPREGGGPLPLRHREREARRRACRRSSNSPGTTRRSAASGSIRPSPISRSLHRFPDHVASVGKMTEMFGDEVPGHLEFIRFDGNVCCCRPADRALHQRGAARRDHPHPRGQRLPDLQSPPLHPGGGRHEADRRGPARLQARGRPARASSTPAR